MEPMPPNIEPVLRAKGGPVQNWFSGILINCLVSICSMSGVGKLLIANTALLCRSFFPSLRHAILHCRAGGSTVVDGGQDREVFQFTF